MKAEPNMPPGWEDSRGSGSGLEALGWGSIKILFFANFLHKHQRFREICFIVGKLL